MNDIDITMKLEQLISENNILRDKVTKAREMRRESTEHDYFVDLVSLERKLMRDEITMLNLLSDMTS